MSILRVALSQRLPLLSCQNTSLHPHTSASDFTPQIFRMFPVKEHEIGNQMTFSQFIPVTRVQKIRIRDKSKHLQNRLLSLPDRLFAGRYFPYYEIINSD
jgi:hypothetical protein